MEIKVKLNKPYTLEAKMDFIVEYNHKLGYEIRETEDELQAWGYSEAEIEEEKIKQFNREFFHTSLGYVRRNVTMQNGAIRDFLTDILPLLKEGVPIITYNADQSQNKNVLVTEEFISECQNQLLLDFYGNLA